MEKAESVQTKGTRIDFDITENFTFKYCTSNDKAILDGEPIGSLLETASIEPCKSLRLESSKKIFYQGEFLISAS